MADEMTPQEQYEQMKAKKEEKEKKKALRSKTSNTLQKVLIAVVVLAVLAGGMWWLAQSQAPVMEDMSEEHSIQSFDHVSDGRTVDNYSTNPPTSGPHYASPAETGFYTEPVPDERVVHNLEHGHVWVAYHPRISQEAQDMLREEFGGNTYAIITPRETNPTDIAVVSWGRMDTFNIEGALDEPELARIDDYIKRYRNTGREQVPPTHRD